MKPVQVRITETEYGLAVPIPEDILSSAGFKEGDTVNLYVSRGQIEVADPAHPHYDIEEMLATITPENLHAEIKTGPPRGNEVW